MEKNVYGSPLVSRYTRLPTQEEWSEDRKFRGWRQLWYEIAKAQQELGLPITEAAVAALSKWASLPIDYARASAIEKDTRHDVMAHIKLLEEAAPAAKGFIHLGCTSCDITDNAELIQLRESLDLLLGYGAAVLRVMGDRAREWRDLPVIGYTHGQPAQMITLGKRVAMWTQEILFAFRAIERQREVLPWRGLKGATGTQESFLALFHGDADKVLQLEKMVGSRLGFASTLTITGQTYSRLIDMQVLDALKLLASAAHKVATDIRLLCMLEELNEPFEKDQKGSSAMPHKRNPMRDERECALARHILALSGESGLTAALQWLERSLDDSAGRRIYLAESFLTADALLLLSQNVFSGLVVNRGVIKRRISEKLPFMAIDDILAILVNAGKDRQEAHECLRRHAIAADERIKQDDGYNDFSERLQADGYFSPLADHWEQLRNPAGFVGLAPQQVDQFLAEELEPAIRPYANQTGGEAKLHV